MQLTMGCGTLVLSALIILPLITASPHTRPFEVVKRQANGSKNSTQVVDLGYELYEGVANSSTGLNTFLGIRFAAPPTGSLRWQRPQAPAVNRSSILPAIEYALQCPQSLNSGSGFGTPSGPASEDCLFLNVYSPKNASNLPVLVWIHGGGYGLGNGQQDMSAFINANGNDIVGVSIQYRLGAFGFLSSDEVFRNGVVNAGLLDQHFALQWVQAYIDLFGGDPTRVTISGVSAGAGSVMLQDIAYGGALGTTLFQNSISASPYLPQQYGYKDWIPSQSFYAFATHAGCPPAWAYGNSSQSIFQCLVAQDTGTLQNASMLVSSSGTYGSWGFLPVTDGVFIQSTPSQALMERKVNGLRHLSGNNAEEGPYFTAQNITTVDDLVAWIHAVFPLFTTDDIAKLLYYYPTSNDTTPSSLPRFATSGDMGATAINVSAVASGQQQRANNIYAEATFICPSYWIADAYNSRGRTGYKYQYSVPWAIHGSDTAAYFGPPPPTVGPDFFLAFQTIWGNFVRMDNPSIDASIANGASAHANGTSTNRTSSPSGIATGELENWPPFTLWDRRMANLNQTGGEEFVTVGGGFNFTQYRDPGLRNDLRLVDAYAWEGGRGIRCDFWRSVADIVPA